LKAPHDNLAALVLVVFVLFNCLGGSEIAFAYKHGTVFNGSTVQISAIHYVSGWGKDIQIANSPASGVQGKVYAINWQGEPVPLAGGLVEARKWSTGQLVASTRTQVEGAFDLRIPPGDYDLRVSASPPASNVNPAFIVGRVLAFTLPHVMIRVGGVNVTAEPLRVGKDFGSSGLTDSAGFFNLTVWPYYSLEAYSTPIHVSNELTRIADIHLNGSVEGQHERSLFHVKLIHREYPVGPEYPVGRVSAVLPGQTHSCDYYLNTGPPVTAAVTFQGNRYTIAVNGNASAWDLGFDPERRLLNFTIGSTYRSPAVGEFVVLIPKQLLDGVPVVFVDNVEVPSAFTENATQYFIRFDYPLSQHAVTVGGSNTIPENISLLVPLLLTVATLSFSRRRARSRSRQTQ